MSAIVVSELLCLLIVLFWPIAAQNRSQVISFHEEEITQLQAPVVTRQQSTPPPPPAPRVPIPIPNDDPVQPKDIKFPEKIASDSIDSLSITAGKGGEGNDNIAGNPEVGPRVIRIDEVTIENNNPYKAEIYVRFLVDTKGKVESAMIQKIIIFDQNGVPTRDVQHLDDSIRNRIIKAALNWKFRPARKDGHPVRAYSTQIFTVDY